MLVFGTFRVVISEAVGDSDKAVRQIAAPHCPREQGPEAFWVEGRLITHVSPVIDISLSLFLVGLEQHRIFPSSIDFNTGSLLRQVWMGLQLFDTHVYSRAGGVTDNNVC